jgi:hypothetical protein
MLSRNSVSRLGTLSLIGLAVLSSLWLVRPPRTVPDSAPSTEFSSARALQHVRAICQSPHPVGSPENARVREYLVRELVSLGPEVQIQQMPSWNAWTNERVVLQNIVARFKGTGGTHALMLLCHYDSVPGGPGAGDDGAGVAAVLESLRAIRAGPPLLNDLIVLITDAEEAKLLGAQAFVAEHPWLNDVGLVMNFEARGYGGPVLLMQTGHQNGWLVREFARAAPHPFGSSFAEDVFRRMPNDTDFTIFRNAGKTGLNFAFFKGLRYYHTDQDTIANLDERSLQHHGSYCLSLARHFGNLNLDQTTDRDYVFFNIFGSVFLYYPLGWSVPISVASSVVFCGVIIFGLLRGRLSWLGIPGGFLCMLTCLVSAPVVVAAVWAAISRLPVVEQSMSRGDVAWADGFSIALAAITAAIFIAVQALFGWTLSVENRMAGALIAWLSLTILSSWFVPRGHYFFAWPLLFSSVGLYALVSVKDRADLLGWRFALFCCSWLPGVLLLVPGIYLISITLGTSNYWKTSVCIILLLGLLTASIELIVFASRFSKSGNNGAPT